MYGWFLSALEEQFERMRLLKKSPRGTVELVRHLATGRQFILRRFRGSAEVYRALLGCTCSHLPQILEAVSQGEDNLVLEEFVQGDTLDFLLRGGHFSPRETRKIAGQLCRALWVLHTLGAVHRDVKPENVILRGGEAILIDFDAARLHKPDHRMDTQVLGTTGFAAPEQYGLSQTDGRADIYALGVLINVMLTGEHPIDIRIGVVERCTRVNRKSATLISCG